MRKHGAAEREFYGETASEWRWTIGGKVAPPQQVCKGIQAGLFVQAGMDRHRVVMTDKGRRFAAA